MTHHERLPPPARSRGKLGQERTGQADLDEGIAPHGNMSLVVHGHRQQHLGDQPTGTLILPQPRPRPNVTNAWALCAGHILPPASADSTPSLILCRRAGRGQPPSPRPPRGWWRSFAERVCCVPGFRSSASGGEPLPVLQVRSEAISHSVLCAQRRQRSQGQGPRQPNRALSRCASVSERGSPLPRRHLRSGLSVGMRATGDAVHH